VKAAVLHRTGGPDVFSIEDVPVPWVGDEEALVEVAACGVSFRDVVERNGTYRRDVSFPVIIGLEISGTVRAVGPRVRDLSVGDRVCSKAFSSCGQCRYCRTARETTCLKRRPVRGGYAEFAALPEDALVRFPASIPFEFACSLGPAAGVALNAVRDVARVTIGETVLVTGATGGVGWPAVQLAKLAGANVLAITRSVEKKTSLVRESGADEVVIARAGDDFSKDVRRLTDGLGADVVIDNVGSRVFNACFDSLALHGRYAMVGQLSGEEVAINPARIFFKRAQLLGVGSVSRVQLEDVIALTAAGKLKPKISAVLPLEDIDKAHAMVEAGEQVGRVIVIPNRTKNGE
jgi:acryloyl-coenzyme A reductase